MWAIITLLWYLQVQLPVHKPSTLTPADWMNWQITVIGVVHNHVSKSSHRFSLSCSHSFSLSVSLSVTVSLFLSLCLCLSVSLSFYLSIYLSIYLSTSPYSFFVSLFLYNLFILHYNSSFPQLNPFNCL